MIYYSWPLGCTLVILLSVIFLYVPELIDILRERLPLSKSHFITFLCGLFVIPACKLTFSRFLCAKNESLNANGSRNSVYGLDHGRLHLRLPLPLWMNMGYWHSSNDLCSRDEANPTVRDSDSKHTLATASRALLSEVLKTAGFESNRQSAGELTITDMSRCLIDLGVGCGDQTVYLMSPQAIRKSDELWWGYKSYKTCFESYIGLTLDRKQFQYALERVQELQRAPFILQSFGDHGTGIQNTKLFCIDAARPDKWDDKLKKHIHTAVTEADESWVLALDTLYHFSPSRWSIIAYVSSTLKASFMAFDLCLADRVSFPQVVLLRILTSLMGAPWANFVTQDEYHRKLVEAGYHDITMRDITDHVFAPLNAFLQDQDRTLRVIGYSLGPFHAAKWMFGWWARTGIIKGVIVVARR